MKQNINDIRPGTLMLVVRNDNGTFSPVGMNKMQSHFLFMCLSSIGGNEPFIKDDDVELSIKFTDNEKERDNSNGND